MNVVRLWLVVVGLVCIAGCGDDDDGEGPAADRNGREGAAGEKPDAGPSSRDGGKQVDPKVLAQYRALLDDWVVEWDRIAQASCECFVTIGAYETVEECVKLVAAGPDWAECASMALAEKLDTLSLDQAQCVVDRLGKRADCVEDSACSEVTLCEGDPAECGLTDTDAVSVVLEACPDTGILSRL